MNFELLEIYKIQFVKEFFLNQRSGSKKIIPFPVLTDEFSILKIQLWLLEKMGNILYKKYFDQIPGCGKNNFIFCF